MDNKDLMELIDEIKKRLRVSYEDAKAALERNQFNLVEALDDLEERSGIPIREKVEETGARLTGPTVTFRRGGQDLVTVPAVVVLAITLIGLKRPKLLLGAGAALLLSGTDAALTCQGKEVSLHESVFRRSRKAAANVQEIRERLDDRLQDMKDQAFQKEGPSHGDRYFTIKL